MSGVFPVKQVLATQLELVKAEEREGQRERRKRRRKGEGAGWCSSGIGGSSPEREGETARKKHGESRIPLHGETTDLPLQGQSHIHTHGRPRRAEPSRTDALLLGCGPRSLVITGSTDVVDEGYKKEKVGRERMLHE